MSERIGVWFVGARGSVATTTTVGALALRAGLAPPVGCVSELAPVARAGLPGLDQLVIGGHDIVGGSLIKRAEELATGGVMPSALLSALTEELGVVDGRIRAGIRSADGDQRAAAQRIEADLRAFRDDHDLSRVVVVDVSSTEAPATESPELHDLNRLESALDTGQSPLPASSLYAYAAFRAGCPVIAFTASPGPRLPALETVAGQAGVPWAGSDGKTGETLMKTVLAPMFAMRALKVRSWASYNLLGGGDGRTLADPTHAASKTATKAQGLEAILGHPVDGPLHIDYVPDHGDWKTAWDMVSFEGFLGTRMSLQFTWSGCDSALAAPLVLDLVRLISRAHELGESGPQPALGFFFKNPVGTDAHSLSEQWNALVQWCDRLSAAGQHP
ncbi:myo-inositol-1-phosphate synthase [Actinobacteria bacterium YIM 96077]|uniref:Myo-inositol-1-phosphate synthase n=1 Tax=Phytoactinopolyspora halophila TaxID=1981511 RepID=A0A329QL28_9ACTN|nr:inositol-3-phosphate synthase [Phytoactinopolyspora halophila]AYY14770.1 myo-inositol-1-phosphate synthase [Actinobacteria bacterium YIM 96077]RAW13044.1 myo-inositol-1-phosphate synthase [Phytoactinopolyspora halophila]